MLKRAGFDPVDARDITTNVLPTWEHCRRLASNSLVQLVLRTKGGKLRRFVDSFPRMAEGYHQGAMAYGMLTAVRT